VISYKTRNLASEKGTGNFFLSYLTMLFKEIEC
jgi:hypothetical protein